MPSTNGPPVAGPALTAPLERAALVAIGDAVLMTLTCLSLQVAKEKVNKGELLANVAGAWEQLSAALDPLRPPDAP